MGGMSDIEDTDIFTLSEDDEEESEGDKVKKEQDRHASFEKLEGAAGTPGGMGAIGNGSGNNGAGSTAAGLAPRRQSQSQGRSPGMSSHRNRRTRIRVPEAYIELKEEKVPNSYQSITFLCPCTHHHSFIDRRRHSMIFSNSSILSE